MVYSFKNDWNSTNSYENLMINGRSTSSLRQGPTSPEKGRFTSSYFRSCYSTPYGSCSMSNLEVGLASLNLMNTNSSFTSKQRSISAKVLPERLFNPLQFLTTDRINNGSEAGNESSINTDDANKCKKLVDQQWLIEQSELRELYLKKGVQNATEMNGPWNSNTQVTGSNEKKSFLTDFTSTNLDGRSNDLTTSLIERPRKKNGTIFNHRDAIYQNSSFAMSSFADLSDTPIWSDPEPNFQFLGLNGHQGDDLPSSYSTCGKGFSSTSDAALSLSMSPSGPNLKGTSSGSPKSDGSHCNEVKIKGIEQVIDSSTKGVIDGGPSSDEVDESAVGNFSTFGGCSANVIESDVRYANEGLENSGLADGGFSNEDNSCHEMSLSIVHSRKTDLVPLSQGEFCPSKDLYLAYRQCGLEYFSATRVFRFIDNLKMLIDGGSNSGLQSANTYFGGENTIGQPVPHFNVSTQAKVSFFVKFLRSCNMNAMSRNNGRQEFNRILRDNTTSQKLPLVLCCAKNGRLELLSPQNDGCMRMTRGDMVIVDGDRGTDLVMVIEPQVGLHLGLLINFLRKKIHFDSLITNTEMHHPNATFIDFLIRTRRGLEPSLNSRRYDVVELTELIIPSKRVLRFATSWEVSSNLHHKFQEELKSFRVAVSKIEAFNEMVSSNLFTRRDPLTIRLLNSEYQFDRKKLTFYYVCSRRNDFRDLIKELFKLYKTRIWLCALPNNLGIEETSCDNKEAGIYKQMARAYGSEVINYGFDSDALFVPPMENIRLDDYHIRIYEEMVKRLF